MPSNKFLAVAGALATAAVAASLIVYFSQQGSSKQLQQAGQQIGTSQSSSAASVSFIAAAPKPTAWVRPTPSPILNGQLVPSSSPSSSSGSGPAQSAPAPIPPAPPITRQPLPVATPIAVVVRTRTPPPVPSPAPSVLVPVIVPRPPATSLTTPAAVTTSSPAKSTSAAPSSAVPASSTPTPTGTNAPAQDNDDDVLIGDNIIDSDAAIIIDANRGRPTSALITAIPTAVPTPPNRRPPSTSSSSSASTTSAPPARPTPTPPGNSNTTLPVLPPTSCTFSFECPSSTCCTAGKCTPAGQANGACTPFAPRSATPRFLARPPGGCPRPPLDCPHLAVPPALLADLTRGDAKYTTPVANLTCPAQPVDRRNATQALACDTRKFTCGTCPTACGACPASPPVVTRCARPGDVLLVIADAGSDFTPALVEDLTAERVPAAWFVSGDKLVGANAAKFAPLLSTAVRSQPGMALGSMGLSHSLPGAFRVLADHRTDVVGAELVVSRLVPAAPAAGGLKFPRVYLAPGAANVSGAPLSLLATLGYTVVAPGLVVGDTLDRFGTPVAVMARLQAALRAQGAAPIVAVRDGSPWGMSMVRDFVKAVKDSKGRMVDLATCLGEGKAVYAATTSQ